MVNIVSYVMANEGMSMAFIKLELEEIHDGNHYESHP